MAENITGDTNTRDSKEIDKPKHGVVYAHFTRTINDAQEIVRTRKLRTSAWQGREDKVFAINLTAAERDDSAQLSRGRDTGVIFTTPFEGEEGEHRTETFWIPRARDKESHFLPLDWAITFGPSEPITVNDVQAVLDIPSPGPYRSGDKIK